MNNICRVDLNCQCFTWRYFGLEGPDVIGPSMDATVSQLALKISCQFILQSALWRILPDLLAAERVSTVACQAACTAVYQRQTLPTSKEGKRWHVSSRFAKTLITL